MSREQSDGEDSVGETRTDRFVNVTAVTEVELRLPLEIDVEPNHIRMDVPINSGAVNLDAVDPDPEMQRRSYPRTGPTRSGPDTGFRCYAELQNPIDSYWGLGNSR